MYRRRLAVSEIDPILPLEQVRQQHSHAVPQFTLLALTHVLDFLRDVFSMSSAENLPARNNAACSLADATTSFRSSFPFFGP
ncbi:hypothetical protein LMG24076_02417 [Trinickia soli]|nr:hypothetical protein LMG24076_02417 [Trinickia soli]